MAGDLNLMFNEFRILTPKQRENAEAWMMGLLSTKVTAEVWNGCVREAMDFATGQGPGRPPKQVDTEPEMREAGDEVADRKTVSAGV